MANPRQRRKARSSSHTPVKHSRRANKLLKKQPSIKGPKALQDAWDKQKTVRQNYAALGLAHSLTPTDSGGRDITQLHSTENSKGSGASAHEGKSGTQEEAGVNAASKELGGSVGGWGTVDNERITQGKIPRGFGKIVRDESGKIVDIVLGDEDADGPSESQDGTLDLMEEDVDLKKGGSRRQPESTDLGSDWLLKGGGREVEGYATEVVQALEEEASARGEGKVARTASSSETKYLQQLVEAHGENYEKMAKDRKRNVMQYTAGQLRRAIGKAGILSGQ